MDIKRFDAPGDKSNRIYPLLIFNGDRRTQRRDRIRALSPLEISGELEKVTPES